MLDKLPRDLQLKIFETLRDDYGAFHVAATNRLCRNLAADVGMLRHGNLAEIFAGCVTLLRLEKLPLAQYISRDKLCAAALYMNLSTVFGMMHSIRNVAIRVAIIEALLLGAKKPCLHADGDISCTFFRAYSPLHLNRRDKRPGICVDSSKYNKIVVYAHRTHNIDLLYDSLYDIDLTSVEELISDADISTSLTGAVDMRNIDVYRLRDIIMRGKYCLPDGEILSALTDMSQDYGSGERDWQNISAELRETSTVTLQISRVLHRHFGMIPHISEANTYSTAEDYDFAESLVNGGQACYCGTAMDMSGWVGPRINIDWFTSTWFHLYELYQINFDIFRRVASIIVNRRLSAASLNLNLYRLIARDTCGREFLRQLFRDQSLHPSLFLLPIHSPVDSIIPPKLCELGFTQVIVDETKIYEMLYRGAQNLCSAVLVRTINWWDAYCVQHTISSAIFAKKYQEARSDAIAIISFAIMLNIPCDGEELQHIIGANVAEIISRLEQFGASEYVKKVATCWTAPN